MPTKNRPTVVGVLHLQQVLITPTVYTFRTRLLSENNATTVIKHYAIVSYLWHLNCNKALKQTGMKKLMMVATIALLASCSPKVGEGVATANSTNSEQRGTLSAKPSSGQETSSHIEGSVAQRPNK